MTMDLARIRHHARAQIRSPLFWILCGAAAMRTVGLTWGLPASDGWDSDGIAPRDFLVGVVKTYQTGEFFTYPPLQLLLLTVVTFPGWMVGIFKAHSFAPPDVIAELIKVPYMTFFAIAARIVSAAMSVGTIVWVGKIGEELGGKRAGVCAAAACALNATLVYYGNVTNLDGPCLFWSTLAVWQWMRAIARHEPRLFRWAGLFTVAAIATKDQAYAVFLLSLPMVFAMWIAADPWPRRNWRLVTGQLCIAIAVASIALLAVDGAITKPARIRRPRFVSSRAGQSGSCVLPARLERPPSVAGRRIRQLSTRVPSDRSVSWGFRPLRSCLASARQPFALGRRVLPPVCNPVVHADIQSHRVAFRGSFCVGSDGIFFRLSGHRRRRACIQCISSCPMGRAGCHRGSCWLAFVQCVAVNTAFLYDARYDAEQWLREHVRQGDTIETYGQNVYLPRFPATANVTRVAPTSGRKRWPAPERCRDTAALRSDRSAKSPLHRGERILGKALPDPDGYAPE